MNTKQHGFYQFADVIFDIYYTNIKCKDLLADYLVFNKPKYTIDICDEDILKEKQEYFEVYNYNVEDVYDYFFEFSAIHRKVSELLNNEKIILLHGSCISINEEGFAFIAKSGTGKSTHTKLWCKLLPDSIMVNDDKPFLKIEDDYVIAYGSPWSGKHKINNNISVKLKSICLIQRSSINFIDYLSEDDVLKCLFLHTYRPCSVENTQTYITNIIKLSKLVKFYKLGCNMDISAAKLSYETMALGKEIDDINI